MAAPSPNISLAFLLGTGILLALAMIGFAVDLFRTIWGDSTYPAYIDCDHCEAPIEIRSKDDSDVYVDMRTGSCLCKPCWEATQEIEAGTYAH